MEERLKVIVDTDILIKAYRGDDIKIQNLHSLKGLYGVSVITAIELIAGAKNIKQLSSFNKVLKVYPIFYINELISKQSFQLYRKYILKYSLGLSDCFIASTALHCNFLLYTDNKKHYDFIEGLKFYKEK
ncbi:MAG TPA: type II toxin-antitoxin system VapC family toxin [Chitinophagaceae bacterium]|nr:type II toxin-antitoxin system VapC family toxin [Chitinophagaceae bacterium]